MIQIKSVNSGIKVAIIGGGISGLSLGYYLCQSGYQVTIFEKNDRLGGLLAATNISDCLIENHYHHFFKSDDHLIRLLLDLDLEKEIIWRGSLIAFYRDNSFYPFLGKSDLFRLPFISSRAKLSALLNAWRLFLLKENKIKPETTAKELICRLFGEEIWRKIWRPIFLNKFGVKNHEQISAQWFARKLLIRTGSAQSRRETLGYLSGSFQKLIKALSNQIESKGSQILLSSPVNEIKLESNGQFFINSRIFDIAISTLPEECLAGVFPALKTPKIPYLGAITSLFVLNNNPTTYYWTNIIDRNFPFSVIINQQAWLPENYYQGKFPLYLGHYLPNSDPLFNKSDSVLFEFYMKYLKDIFPGSEKSVLDYQISRSSYAQPVFFAGWQPLNNSTNIRNFYTTSLAHIFPEDRGINYAIKEAKTIANLINTERPGSQKSLTSRS